MSGNVWRRRLLKCLILLCELSCQQIKHTNTAAQSHKPGDAGKGIYPFVTCFGSHPSVWAPLRRIKTWTIEISIWTAPRPISEGPIRSRFEGLISVIKEHATINFYRRPFANRNSIKVDDNIP